MRRSFTSSIPSLSICQNSKQIFQLAYRAVTRELYVIMEGAARIQAAYQGQVERGVVPGDVPTPAGLMATDFLMNAYEAYQYRSVYFDAALAARDYQVIQHDVLKLTSQKPTLAVSSLFSLRGLLRDDNLVPCVLNIMPVSGVETVVVSSYVSDDASMARAALDRLFAASGDYQKYELSKLIIDRIENFVLSPSHFASWSSGKVKIIQDAFVSTILSENHIPDNSELMLF